MDLPRGYLSYNQIRLYQECPRKYHFRYIQEVEAPINDKVFLGIIFHAAVEAYLKKRIDNHLLDLDSVRDIFKREWEKQEPQFKITWSDSKENFHLRGRGFLDFFMANVAPGLRPLMVEKELELLVPEVGVPIRGIIDLVEEDFCLTDFKTASVRWPRNRINKSSLQMLIYKYLFEGQFGAVNCSLKFRIFYAKQPGRIHYQESVLVPEEVDTEKMFNIIRYVIRNISDEHFEKNISYVCNYCEFFDVCQKED